MSKTPSKSPRRGTLPDLSGDETDDALRRKLSTVGAGLPFARTAGAGPGADVAASDAGPAPAAEAPPEAGAARSRGRGLPGTVGVSVMLPAHLNRELTVRAAERGVTKRYLIVEALREAGYDVRPEDLTEDGRRART